MEPIAQHPDTLRRLNDGWLRLPEAAALGWMVARLPGHVSPNHLTLIGVVGTLIACAGYLFASWNPAWLWVASLGLGVNWFGDSLDGSLARHRRIERPRFGYFLDNAVDIFQNFLLAVAIGASGFVRWDLCFLALSVFFMTSMLALLQSRVFGEHQLSYGGVGMTELRVGLIALNTLIFFVPPQRADWLGLPLTYPDLLMAAWSLSALVVFGASMIMLIRRLSAEDPPRGQAD